VPPQAWLSVAVVQDRLNKRSVVKWLKAVMQGPNDVRSSDCHVSFLLGPDSSKTTSSSQVNRENSQLSQTQSAQFAFIYTMIFLLSPCSTSTARVQAQQHQTRQ